MDKFIGFDIDHKHPPACAVQPGQPHQLVRGPGSRLRRRQDKESHRAGVVPWFECLPGDRTKTLLGRARCSISRPQPALLRLAIPISSVRFGVRI